MDDRKVEREGENCSRKERKFTNWADSDRKNSISLEKFNVESEKRRK